MTSLPSRQRLDLRRYLLPWVLFFACLYLAHPIFLPSLDEINPWDEASYIHNGQMLVDHGVWTTFANNPLTSLFYAATYLPYRSSPFWLVQSCSLGRLLLYTLLWWSAYLVASRLSRYASPAITVGLLLVTPLALEFLRFPSDPMFAGLAALSLWQFLGYLRTTQTKNLAWASGFMGLAALARNDGTVLFAILLSLTLIFNLIRLRSGSWRNFALNILAVLLPFVCLVGGYILFYGLRSGNFNPEIMERTYDNFEAGQQIIFSGDNQANSVLDSKLEARQYFGTPQENNNSVFTAIRRNPQIYLLRLRMAVKNLPGQLLAAYGIRFAIPIFLLALLGIWRLVRQRRFALLLVLCLWPAHLVTGFVITLFRTGHLQFPFYVVYLLAAIGITALVEQILSSQNIREAQTTLIWMALLVVICLAGLLAGKLAVYYGAALLLLALICLWAARPILPRQGAFAIACLVLLSAGLVVHGNFPSPSQRKLGFGKGEGALLALQQQFPEGTAIAAGAPGPVWASKMIYSGLSSTDVSVEGKTAQSFLDWLQVQGVRAIYVDANLYQAHPTMWKLIQSEIGARLNRIYQEGDGNIQILQLQDKP